MSLRDSKLFSYTAEMSGLVIITTTGLEHHIQYKYSNNSHSYDARCGKGAIFVNKH